MSDHEHCQPAMCVEPGHTTEGRPIVSAPVDHRALIEQAGANPLAKELRWLASHEDIRLLSLHVESAAGKGVHLIAPDVLLDLLDTFARLAVALAESDEKLNVTYLQRDAAQIDRNNASARLIAVERERDVVLEKLTRRAELTHHEWMSEAGKAFRERFAHDPAAKTLTPLGFFEAGAEWAAAIADGRTEGTP